MENASKALIISGGILIAILIISGAIFLYVSASKAPVSYEETLGVAEIQKFNSNFTQFEGRDDIKAQEIVTLVNFVKEHNNIASEQIKVYIGSEDFAQKDNLVEFIKDSYEKTYKINQIKNIKYGSEGKASEIYFIENSI